MTTLPDRLTPLDGTFLELEDADPSAHMHIGGVLVFGPRPEGGTPTLGELRAHLESRLDALPRYRQRLGGPGAGGLTWQRWVRADDFRIERHVLGAELPAPGGWDELLAWAGDYFSERLERAHPLWEVVLVGGLGADHWALVTKTHHCLVDGVGSVEAAHLLFDSAADALGAHPADEHRFPLPAWLSPTAYAHAAAVGVRAVTHPDDLARRAAALADLLVREEVLAAPHTSLNEPIGTRRVLRGISVELDEVRLVRRALGGTVNDVVLAGVTAGLRALLLGRGEDPPERLRAMVPMNVRTGEAAGALGNRVSSLFVELPVGDEHPTARYERIREETAAVKTGRQPLGADTLLRVAGLAPPVLHQLVAGELFGRRLFNVTVTNVPGPPAPMNTLGAPLEAIWPLVPIAACHGVGIAIISYEGRLTFGVNADADTVPDVDVLAGGIAEGLAELQRLAHAAVA